MELKKQAETLSKTQRRKIIMDYPETDLHHHLKELFQAMEPNYTVEITHGSQEFGKDLVIVKTDKFTKEVIGVVVKCGDIKGKTLGDIDNLKDRVETALSKGTEKRVREIESQIEQTLAHPAEMKSILENLSVSKVFVVLAGEFSKQARTRLTGELASKTEIFDINWLIDKFTEFYPQIFFEGRAIDFLEKKIRELEENHRLGYSGKNLSEYFVDPLVMTLGDPINFDEESIRLVLKNRKLPFSNLVKICKKVHKLILLGDPGSGKTGSMAKLAIDMYKEASSLLLKKLGNSDKKISVPVFVSVRQLLESKSEKDFLEKYFESEEVQNRFKVDMIIVDGLDEIVSEQRATIISKLDEFSEAIGCSYILTSRKVDIINTLPQKYQKYELLPFEFNQALRLFSKLINDHKILGTMRESLEKIQVQILLVPLSLMLLIELVEEHKEVPTSVTELYDRFFDMALGREDREKGIEVLFDYLIKKRFLGVLAYREFLCKNRLEIPVEDFKQFLASYVEQYGWSRENLEGFAQEIERAGILDLRAEVNFKHRSFLDYFAAFYIYENREDLKNLNDLIVDTYFDDIWGEVSFFYIGLRREISQDLLEGIYSYKGDVLTTGLCKLLGGRLLQAGWHSPTEQHVYGIEKAISYAPRVREKFQEIIASSDSNIPNIVSDFITLSLTDLSFNSGFLERHIRNIFKQLITSKSPDNIYKAVALFWSMHRFLKPDEVKESINDILDGVMGFPANEQARVFLLMMLIEEDKKIMKPIRRQMSKLTKRSPEVVRALLPAKRKGFR